MDFYLIRHGQSVNNASPDALEPDPALTNLGREQANRVGEFAQGKGDSPALLQPDVESLTDCRDNRADSFAPAPRLRWAARMGRNMGSECRQIRRHASRTYPDANEGDLPERGSARTMSRMKAGCFRNGETSN